MLNRSDFTKLIVGTALLVAFSFVSYFFVIDVVGREQIEELLTQAGIFAPLLVIVIKASELIFAPLDGHPTYILSALLFGTEKGFLYTYIGDIIGSVLSFTLARTYGKKIIGKLAGKKALKLIDTFYSRLGQWKGIFFISLLGISDYVNYIAGLTPIPLWKFTLVVMLYRIPLNMFSISLAYFPEYSSLTQVLFLAVIAVYIFLTTKYFYTLNSGAKRKAGYRI